MRYILSEDNVIVSNLDRLEFPDLSVNIPKAVSFFCKEECSVYSSMENLIEGVDENQNITLGNSIHVDAGKSFSILFESSEEKLDVVEIKCIFQDEELSFKIYQQYVDVTDRLIVLLNNYGIQLNSEWMHAFYETDIHEKNIDVVVKDRKSSEFLLEVFKLVGLRGTYKTLFAAVAYFGYSELVWFEEHWISQADGVTKRYTTVTSEFIDKALTEEGFTKIGDMTMFYHLDVLDPDEPYDEGGLPNYIKSNTSFDDLYYKLLLLRKILNHWFIPWDAWIVDIVGELRAVDGHLHKDWVTQDDFINQDEEQRWDFIDVDYEDMQEDEDGIKHLFMEERKMIVDYELYTVMADDTIKLNQSDTAQLKARFFKIEKLDIDELVDLKDFDIITRFQRKDVAVLIPNITLKTEEVPWWVNGFAIEIYKKSETGYDLIYCSRNLLYEQLTTNARYGISELGEFLFIISVYDCWGYRKQYTIKFVVELKDILVDIRLLRPRYLKHDNSRYLNRYSHFESTHETLQGDGVPVVDAAFTNGQDPALWDVNDPDNVTESIVRRQYSLKYQNLKMLMPISRYSNVVPNSMKVLPIDEYYAPFDLLVLNILKRGLKFSLKKFTHHEYVTVQFENQLQFQHDLVEESKVTDSPFAYFDFDIQWVDPYATERLLVNENLIASEMLMIYSRYKSFSIDKLIFRIELGDEILTNDPTTQGTLTLNQKQITFYGRPLTLYMTNKAAEEFIWQKDESPFDVYHNYIYPSFGCDAMIRMNTLYNTTEMELYRLRLYEKTLTLYDRPLTLYQNPGWMEAGRTGILQWYHQNLTYHGDTLVLYPDYDKHGHMNIDNHLKFRYDNTWWVSLNEYGKPVYEQDPDTKEWSMTMPEPPLDFEHLKRIFDKWDPNFTNELELPDEVLDNLDVYYYDSNFVIRCRNGHNIEICQMNIGHKICEDRTGAIERMYIVTSGTSFQLGSCVMALPNEDIKIGNCDIVWTITDYITGTDIIVAEGYCLKWVPMTVGLYNIKMKVTDKNTGSSRECSKVGAILVEA